MTLHIYSSHTEKETVSGRKCTSEKCCAGRNAEMIEDDNSARVFCWIVSMTFMENKRRVLNFPVASKLLINTICKSVHKNDQSGILATE